MLGISVCELFRNSIYEELHNLYPSPGIIRMMKSSAGHVARMGRRGMDMGYWWENQEERDH
jgi:hypothetical protein